MKESHRPQSTRASAGRIAGILGRGEMREQLRKLEILAAAAAFVVTFRVPAQAQHGWPLEPMSSDHPVGTTFGEYVRLSSDAYQHKGVDIIREAGSDQVRVAVGGVVKKVIDATSGVWNQVTILGSDGITYRYLHLAPGIDPAIAEGAAVAAGAPISKVVDWTHCDFNHLHYDLNTDTSGGIDGEWVHPSGDWLDPMADIVPKPDPDPPVIDAVGFARDNSDPWSEFTPLRPQGCVRVDGKTDIVVKARDRDDAGLTHIGSTYFAGTETLWVRDVRWRACPDSFPDCGWRSTHLFDRMENHWGNSGNTATEAYFSERGSWESNANYCAVDRWFYAIITNFGSTGPDIAGSWDTTTIADGGYTVSVKLTDFAGNSQVSRTRVCVQNSPGCTPELTIRDAADDTGVLPYETPPWWLSPDITPNPGTPIEDRDIVVGAANQIEVRVSNFGGCDLPAGTAYQVCLGWGAPSAMVPHPLPAAQVVGCVSETVAGGHWLVGQERVTTFNWTPAAGSVPLGGSCLVAWVDLPGDPVRSTSAVNWDDNRAQQNITFTALTAASSAAAAFWFVPEEEFSRRSMEFRFASSSQLQTLERVTVHLTPGIRVADILGGRIVGGYEGDEPPDQENAQDPCASPDLTWEEAEQRGCTRIIGGMHLSGRLLLRGLEADRPVKLELRARARADAGRGQFADVQVVERALPQGHKEETDVGGLTLRFEH